jgi:hypothetical protein
MSGHVTTASTAPREHLAWLMWCYQQGYTNPLDRAILDNWMGDDPAMLTLDDVRERRELLGMADEVLAETARALTALQADNNLLRESLRKIAMGTAGPPHVASVMADRALVASREFGADLSVWLAGKYKSGPHDDLGAFSAPDLAKAACQKSAEDYYGPKLTEPLQWKGDDNSSSASHYDPGNGNVVYQVTRYRVDEP